MSTEVQDNVTYVPFHMKDEIVRCCWRGVELEDIAVTCGATVSVIRAIVKAHERKLLRGKYLGDKEPA